MEMLLCQDFFFSSLTKFKSWFHLTGEKIKLLSEAMNV
jgi:hypothetical protein